MTDFVLVKITHFIQRLKQISQRKNKSNTRKQFKSTMDSRH